MLKILLNSLKASWREAFRIVGVCKSSDSLSLKWVFRFVMQVFASAVTGIFLVLASSSSLNCEITPAQSSRVYQKWRSGHQYSSLAKRNTNYIYNTIIATRVFHLIYVKDGLWRNLDLGNRVIDRGSIMCSHQEMPQS